MGRITVLSCLVFLLSAGGCASSSAPRLAREEEPSFPAPVDTLVQGVWARCEGIAFSGTGELYVTGNQALWRVTPDGATEKLCTMYSNLGLAPIGEEDVLAADFGPTSAFNGVPLRDGLVYRITPQGEQTRLLDRGIIDPNFIVVRADGSLLISDDSVDEIWQLSPDGELRLFTDAIGNPNGMVLSLDERWLYVAQIFDGIHPIVWDDRIWKLPLGDDGGPAGPPERLAEVGEGHDGLAMDVLGRVYTASNNSGQILRIDPTTAEVTVICEGVDGVASLAFGRGAFDPQTLYATNHRNGLLFSVFVGIEGAPLHH